MLATDVNDNVAIGSANTHGYKLAVNGTIHTKEVKVDLIDWPDFVFSKAYKLPMLSSVKKYIDQYHHLPEVHSQTAVAENGVNLGEMVKVQTKKIEELTLYAISQQQQIEQLKQLVKKNKKQEGRLAKLEAVFAKVTHN